MLLNLDRKHRSAILHDEECRSVPKPYGTSYKPVGDMGRDGAWFEVQTYAEAIRTATEHLPVAEVSCCDRCAELLADRS